MLDIAVTADNARFASVGGDKTLFLWDVATARTLRRWAGHAGRVNAVGLGGEGGQVVVSGEPRSEKYSSGVQAEEGHALITGWRLGSFDATVRLWDCKSPSTKPIQIFEEAKDSVSTLHVAGHEIVVGSVDGRMRTYDLRMGIVYVDVIGRECGRNGSGGSMEMRLIDSDRTDYIRPADS